MLCDLVLQPDRPEETERLLEPLSRLFGDLSGVTHRAQPLQGALVAAPGTDVVGPGEVGRDRDAAVLDVEPPRVFALRLHHQVPEEPGRGLQVESPSGEVSDENRVRARCASHYLVERGPRLERPGDLSVVKVDQLEVSLYPNL